MIQFFKKNKRRKLSRIPDNSLYIRAIVRTDTGCVRDNNEDNAAFKFPDGSKTTFFAMVADGMGGYDCGEVASSVMVNTFLEAGADGLQKPRQWIKGLLEKANTNIYNQSKALGSVMGTTCSLFLIKNKRIYCGHIGDSRIFLLTDDKFYQVTTDQTIAEMLFRKGEITAAAAAVHPNRNILTQAVGTKPEITPDIFKLKQTVRAGSRFLLCSDGLYDQITNDEIRDYMKKPSMVEVAESLIALAKERGGYDNITVVIVEINDKLKFKDND